MPEKKHILLLIEDNPLLIGMYRTAFEKKGFEVLFAHDGKIGIQLAEENSPEIILLDLLMPGTNGFDVLRALKNSPKTKKVKVVVLTVITDRASKEKAAQLGAIDYLVKPELKLNEIVEKVSSYLAK